LTLDAIREKALNCSDCAIAEKRNNVVFGEGDPDLLPIFHHFALVGIQGGVRCIAMTVVMERGQCFTIRQVEQHGRRVRMNKTSRPGGSPGLPIVHAS